MATSSESRDGDEEEEYPTKTHVTSARVDFPDEDILLASRAYQAIPLSRH